MHAKAAGSASPTWPPTAPARGSANWRCATPCGCRSSAAGALPETDLLPDVSDLPEFLSASEFKQRFGAVGSPAYQRMMRPTSSRAWTNLQPCAESPAAVDFGRRRRSQQRRHECTPQAVPSHADPRLPACATGANWLRHPPDGDTPPCTSAPSCIPESSLFPFLPPLAKEVLMNLTISGHHLEVTPALREYVLTKLDRVTRHFDQVVDVNVLADR
jgi:hypothetical protein